MRLVLAATLTGCVALAEDTGTWEPVETITGPLTPELGPPPPARELGSTLRVATWNVHLGADPDGLAANLRASVELARADVILVQEIEAHPGEPATRSRRLAEALGMTWIYAPARTEGDGTHGIAILSTLPLEAGAVRQLPYFEQPIHARERNALEVDLVAGGRRIRIVDVHLDVRIGPADRILQLHPAVIDQPDPVLLGGDFNTNPWAWIESTVPLTGTEAIVGQDQAAIVDDYLFENAWVGAVPADTATLRVPVFDIRLDNLYSRGLPLLAAGVEHVEGSDHWPVWFDVALD
ncbi:MAG: endonuclease/exonuclease/phosphatase family protein [Kofleriaceae bacterium]